MWPPEHGSRIQGQMGRFGTFVASRPARTQRLVNPRPYGAGAYPRKCVEAPYRRWGAAGGGLIGGMKHFAGRFGAGFSWFWEAIWAV